MFVKIRYIYYNFDFALKLILNILNITLIWKNHGNKIFNNQHPDHLFWLWGKKTISKQNSLFACKMQTFAASFSKK